MIEVETRVGNTMKSRARKSGNHRATPTTKNINLNNWNRTPKTQHEHESQVMVAFKQIVKGRTITWMLRASWKPTIIFVIGKDRCGLIDKSVEW